MNDESKLRRKFTNARVKPLGLDLFEKRAEKSFSHRRKNFQSSASGMNASFCLNVSQRDIYRVNTATMINVFVLALIKMCFRD